MTDVAALDIHIKLLRDEAYRLRAMKVQWALEKANRFDDAADVLVTVRREKQMTGIGGKPITG